MGGSSNILDEPRAVEITGKIMVAAVILLFMVSAFVLLLHLYTKCFLRRVDEEIITFQPRVHRRQPLRRRRRRRPFVFAPGQDPIIYGSDHYHVGLDPSVLRSLPVLVFQPHECKDGLECAVCLSELVQGEKARILPKCNHGFHVDCIDMWFQSHSTCPLCRTIVTTYERSKPVSSSSPEDSALVNSESSQAENSDDMSGLESSNFPTHVLVWGDQTQFSSVGVPLEEGIASEEPPCLSSSTSNSSANDGGIDSTSTNKRCNGMLVIDIPSDESTSSSLSPSASNRCAEDEMKSPMAAKLRSLTRLLSRDKKSSPFSPNSVDVEQANSKEFHDGIH